MSADKIYPAKTALVLIEFQNEFTTEGGKLHGAVRDVMTSTGMLEKSKSLMDAARAKGITIANVPITFSDDYRELSCHPYGILANVKAGGAFKASEWGGAICETMTPAAGDVTIQGKRGLCGFASTNLDFVLRQKGVETILLAGFLTNCCVESTMRTGYEKGYKVITVIDACAATSQEGHDAAVNFTFPMFSTPLTAAEVLEKL